MSGQNHPLRIKSNNIVGIKIYMDSVILPPPTHASMHTTCSHSMACFLQHPKTFFYSYVLEYFVLVCIYTYICMYIYTYLCLLTQAKILLLSVCIILNQDNQCIPLIISFYSDCIPCRSSI